MPRILQFSLTKFHYNEKGELVYIDDPKGNRTTYLYDSAGLVKKVQLPRIVENFESDTTFEYDIVNHTAKTIDAKGNETKFTLNDHYIITSVEDSLRNTTYLDYDTNYNLERVRNPRGFESVFKYDSKGNVEKITDALLNETTITYNSFSQPLTVTDNDGTDNYTYNMYGDVITYSSVVNGEAALTKYSYYEPYGNLKSIELPDKSVIEYAYDSKEEYPKEVLNGLNQKTTFDFDIFGNMNRLVDPEGHYIEYEFDNFNQIKKAHKGERLNSTYTYDSTGNLISVKNGNDNKIEFKYNAQKSADI